MKSVFHRLLADRSGVTAIEYGLIAALIAVAIVGSATLVGTDLNQTFTTIASELGGGGGGGGAGGGVLGGGGGGGGITQGPTAQ